MGRVSTQSQLAALRAKTDRQLRILIQRELERSLILAHVATGKESALYAQAESGYTRVKALLTKIQGLRRDERERLEGKLRELRGTLDLAASEKIRRQTACSA